VKLGLFGFPNFDQIVGNLDRYRGPSRDHPVKVFDFPVDFHALFTHRQQHRIRRPEQRQVEAIRLPTQALRLVGRDVALGSQHD
jgi:hypothetical protein